MHSLCRGRVVDGGWMGEGRKDGKWKIEDSDERELLGWLWER